ncbi:hypothetical protein L914_15266 [Phytophthora nicotianae]|uniref:Uncharacterized protein n=3 Tax=Phytophthora nicotianae TaxID=4792 RepID=V9EJX9_PHYNI|nr:hypothetical protein F443_15856 [Phytophthora nicotianae P1569]ETM38424.1 hypothetical protein L914_15266 [Phytophthora nicotianae]ETO67163.1 hypothetical protein F444_15837 [Phytophthora nicotianae P1976]
MGIRIGEVIEGGVVNTRGGVRPAEGGVSEVRRSLGDGKVRNHDATLGCLVKMACIRTPQVEDNSKV